MTLYYKPSVFELLASESLRSGLREAIMYTFDKLNNVQHKIYRNIYIGNDELLLFLDFIIEFSHLKSYNATYAENFYYLSRLNKKYSHDKIHYQKANLLLSLFEQIIAPYFKGKLDKYVEHISYKPIQTENEKLHLRIYKYLTKSHSLINLIFLVSYSAGKTDHYNLWNKLVNLVIMGHIVDKNQDNNINETVTQKLLKLTADSFGKALTFASLTIQFLDYWNMQSNSAPLLTLSYPTPKAPEKFTMPLSDSKSANICAICRRLRRNECVLSNTGYVFCYVCIQEYVEKHQSCPITGNSATEENIVRLYSEK